MSIIIKTIGEKLSEERGEIGASQNNIAWDENSRRLLSRYENNEIAKIDSKLIRKFVRNMNKYIDVNNLDKKKIDIKYILKTEKQQIVEIIKEYSQDTEKLENLDIIYLESKINKYHGDEKIVELSCKIYEAYADYLYQKEDYVGAVVYFNKCIKKERSAALELNKLRAYVGAEMYSQAIYTGEELLKMKLDKDVKKSAYYNTATAYKSINQYEKAINYIDLLLAKKLVLRQRFDVLILKGNLLADNNKKDEAKTLYENILNVSDICDEVKMLSYSNLAKVYYDQDKYDLARKNMLIALKYINNKEITEFNKRFVYRLATMISVNLNDIQNAIKYSILLLKCCITLKKNTYCDEIVSLLFKTLDKKQVLNYQLKLKLIKDIDTVLPASLISLIDIYAK